jgi:hypothetical protein
VAHHRGPLDSEGVEEQGGVCGELIGAVPAGRLVGTAVSALAGQHHVEIVREQRQEELERAPGVGDAVEEENRRPCPARPPPE